MRPLADIEHPLLAKGVVLDDGGERFVLCAMDWCEVCNGTHSLLRRKMAEAAGTDASRVAVHTIHQHTAPMGDGDASTMCSSGTSPEGRTWARRIRSRILLSRIRRSQAKKAPSCRGSNSLTPFNALMRVFCTTSSVVANPRADRKSVV